MDRTMVGGIAGAAPVVARSRSSKPSGCSNLGLWREPDATASGQTTPGASYLAHEGEAPPETRRDSGVCSVLVDKHQSSSRLISRRAKFHEFGRRLTSLHIDCGKGAPIQTRSVVHEGLRCRPTA
ncbi:hypothetical protein KM043_003968 [Ampulex compressa]|nr:hypothetical protein KM043_003968 [Ampulex compressa]